MEPLADAVGLRGHSLCFRVFLYRLLPDKAGNHADLLCHSTPCLCRSVFSASAGPDVSIPHNRAIHI